jgi:eukaryotic-like serine/threonine-protein kinase
VVLLLDPQIAASYEVLDKLREGGMGAIYRVRHRLLDEVRVVKVIRAAHPTEEAGARFLQEARAAIRLRHPNVAVLHDFAVAQDGHALIVMELIEGWSLLELLRGYGPPPLPLTLEIARQALKALGYLHRHRFVHRDISPDNLMLTRDVDGQPLVKLIDLGIAKTLAGQTGQAAGPWNGNGNGGRLTTEGAFLGKPRYASPEQFGSAGTSGQSDLYSFAVVLYELLTGELPVRGNDLASFMAGHLLLPPVPFEETDPAGRVPKDLRAVILQALAKKPAERPADAAAFAQALADVQERYPLARVDFDAVLASLRPPGAAAAPRVPGSTAEHIDRRFGRGTVAGMDPAPDLPLASLAPIAPLAPGRRDESTRRVRMVPAETLTWRPPILDAMPPAVGFVGFDAEPEPEPVAHVAQVSDTPLELPLEPGPAPCLEPRLEHDSAPASEPDAEEWPAPRPADSWPGSSGESRWPIGFPARRDPAAAEARPEAPPAEELAAAVVVEQPSSAPIEEPPAVHAIPPPSAIPAAAMAAPEEDAWARRALREPEPQVTAVSVGFERLPDGPARGDGDVRAQRRGALLAAALALLVVAGGASWQVAGRASARTADADRQESAAAATSRVPAPADPSGTRAALPSAPPAPTAEPAESAGAVGAVEWAEPGEPEPPLSRPLPESSPADNAVGSSKDGSPAPAEAVALSANAETAPPPPARPSPATTALEPAGRPAGSETRAEARSEANKPADSAPRQTEPKPSKTSRRPSEPAVAADVSPRSGSKPTSRRKSAPHVEREPAAAASSRTERTAALSAPARSPQRSTPSPRVTAPRQEPTRGVSRQRETERSTLSERTERTDRVERTVLTERTAAPQPKQASRPITYTIPFEEDRPSRRARRGDFFLAGRDVSSPVPLAFPSYRYPAAGRGSGRVSVRVALLVDEHGGVMETSIREGGPPGRGFDEAALAAARRTRFQPAYRGNVAGKMWTELIFDFVE